MDGVRAISTFAVSLAITAGPIAAGWLGGRFLRRARGRRVGGVFAGLTIIVVPVLAALLFDVVTGTVGLWDAFDAGVLFGFGVLLSFHRALARRSDVAVLLSACAAGVVFLDVSARIFLPPPPAFPSSHGPSLFLADAISAARMTGYAPSEAGRIACIAIYGGDESIPVVAPRRWRPRGDASRAILHLGDSMVYGGPEGRFTADLERLEPGIEHVNASIAGTGPDVYVSLLRLFLAEHQFAAVVVHLTPNDYYDVDAQRYPCSPGASLLVYGGGHARLRGWSGAAWRGGEASESLAHRFARLARISPAPYPVRAALRISPFAAHLAAAWREATLALSRSTDAEREEHLRVILGDARDELAARGIPLVVDLIRERRAVEAGEESATMVVRAFRRIASDLGIVTIDPWQPLVASVRGGVSPFTNAGGPADPHFNSVGHALIADWLHERLPAAIARARRSLPSHRQD